MGSIKDRVERLFKKCELNGLTPFKLRMHPNIYLEFEDECKKTMGEKYTLYSITSYRGARISISDSLPKGYIELKGMKVFVDNG